jgi:hypothetical protein
MKTEKMGIVEELAAKYKERLARAQQELKEDEKSMRGQCSYVSDLLLFWKWAYRVGKGWYGFNLGHIPPVWTNMLDEFLCWLEIQCPDFEIQQIKMKLGSVRVYVGTHSKDNAVNEKVNSEISKLRNLMRTPQNIRNVRASIRADLKKRQQPPRKQ